MAAASDMASALTLKSCFQWAGRKVLMFDVCAGVDRLAGSGPAGCDCWELPRKVVRPAYMVSDEICLMSRCTEEVQGVVGTSHNE